MNGASFGNPMHGKDRSGSDERDTYCAPSPRSSRRGFLGSFAVALATATLLFGLVGCGGGTRGTGDQLKTTVVGTVVDTSGQTVPGATVTQLETGDSTATDNQGRFALQVVVENGAARLLIERDGFEGSATLTGFPDDTEPTTVEFTITIDLVSGIVTDVTVNDSGPQPTPRPTGTPDNVVREHSIRGRVVNQSGSPVSNVRLSVAGNGSVVSGGDGRFSLLVRTTSSRIRITVRFGQNRGSFLISGLPTGRDAEVELTVRLAVSSAPQYANGELADPKFSVGVSNIRIR